MPARTAFSWCGLRSDPAWPDVRRIRMGEAAWLSFLSMLYEENPEGFTAYEHFGIPATLDRLLGLWVIVGYDSNDNIVLYCEGA